MRAPIPTLSQARPRSAHHTQAVALTRGRRALAWAFFFAVLSRPAAAVDARGAQDRAARSNPPYAQREDVTRFVQEMTERHGFSSIELERLFARVRRNDTVIRLITPKPARERPTWHEYRRRFTEEPRVGAGVAFWDRHRAALEQAFLRYGVPEEIVVAILGVETIYGRNTGTFRVAEALSTLAFDYPRRAAFFRGELENFLLHAREERIDPVDVRGSFAGAIGMPQFMPSSIRRYAVDFDGDGRIDLRTNPVDVVGSVARFLAEHGWERGSPTRLGVVFERRDAIDALVDAGIEPRFSVEQLAARGVIALPAQAAGQLLALIDLPNGDAPADYFLGTRNFYVITRYNRSSFYAMAVIELAERLREARDSGEASRPPADSQAGRAARAPSNRDQPGNTPVDR